MENVFKIDDEYSFLTKELLTKEYVENKLTDKQIAEKYNIKSKTTVWRRRKFLGIQNACQNKSNRHASINRKFDINKDEAIFELNNGLTYVEIAQKMGCSRMVAYRRLKELGLIEDQHKSMNKTRWHEALNDNQTKFLLGCLLGDGNITPAGMFQCNHSNKQLDYIKYKKDVLASLLAPNFELIFNTIKNHQNGKTYYGYYLRTMSNENLKEMYARFYINRVKIFPYDYLINSCFDAYSLAIWYMDDGGINGNIPSIYTYSFGYNGNLDVLKLLKNKFDIMATIKIDDHGNRSPDMINYVSFNDVCERDKFFRLISPYILPSFHYKLPPSFRAVQSVI